MSRIEIHYLASPFTHPKQEVQRERHRAVSWVAHWLHLQKRYVYSPIVHNIPIGDLGVGEGWDHWQGFDLSMVSRLDGVIVLQLPGWDRSVGVGEEIELAKKLGMPVEMMQPPWEEMERALGRMDNLLREELCQA